MWELAVLPFVARSPLSVLRASVILIYTFIGHPYYYLLGLLRPPSLLLAAPFLGLNVAFSQLVVGLGGYVLRKARRSRLAAWVDLSRDGRAGPCELMPCAKDDIIYIISLGAGGNNN